jgi:hypothetical protein
MKGKCNLIFQKPIKISTQHNKRIDDRMPERGENEVSVDRASKSARVFQEI